VYRHQQRRDMYRVALPIQLQRVPHATQLIEAVRYCEAQLLGVVSSCLLLLLCCRSELGGCRRSGSCMAK
jgi:hypothetical protein